MSQSKELKDAVCLRLRDGTLVDISSADPTSASIVTAGEKDGLHVLRHSAAHVLAQAVLSLYPGAKYAIGPPIEEPPGFYYDFDIGRPFTPEDLEKIESRMREIVAEGQPF